MTTDYASYIFIHRDSVGSLLGSLLIFCFSLFLFFQAKLYKTDRIISKIITLQLSFIIFLTGYSLYASSRETAQVLFWSRICYTGVAMITFTGFRFSSALKEASRSEKFFFILLPLLSAIAIWLPGDHFFTSSLNAVKTHSSLIKGPLFPHLVITYTLVNGYLALRMLIHAFRHRNGRFFRPLIIGLTGSFLTIGFYGIYSALLSQGTSQMWTGVVLMAFCLTWYAHEKVRDIREEKRSLEQERDRYYNDFIHDSLTGVFTREYIRESLSRCISQLRRNSRLYALVYIDIDDFKRVNDEAGHDKGDELLCTMGRILQEKTRLSDVPARMGGDEFLVLLEDCSPEMAVKAAEGIRDRYIYQGKIAAKLWKLDYNPTLSMGILCSRYWEKDQDEIIHRADEAMYASKRAGKNRITLYSPKILDGK